MSVSTEDKTAAAAIKKKANEAFECEPTPASNSLAAHATLLAECSKTVHGRGEAIWRSIGEGPHRSYSMVESRVHSDEFGE